MTQHTHLCFVSVGTRRTAGRALHAERAPELGRRVRMSIPMQRHGYHTRTAHAGMGRAPAVALAYLWWVKGMHLEDTHELLLSKRMCHPKLFAIREAAADILYGGEDQVTTIRKYGSSRSSVVEIAGARSHRPERCYVPATHAPFSRESEQQ